MYALCETLHEKKIHLPMNTVANICQEAGNVLTMDRIT